MPIDYFRIDLSNNEEIIYKVFQIGYQVDVGYHQIEHLCTLLHYEQISFLKIVPEKIRNSPFHSENFCLLFCNANSNNFTKKVLFQNIFSIENDFI